jgi:hypothetical protein
MARAVMGATGDAPHAFEPYGPLDVPKLVAEDIWIVDGPEIRLEIAGLGVPFPTRMTIVRLPDSGLWLHSPVRPSDRLVSELGRLGRVRFLIAPNSLHYWWLPEWQALFPRAVSFGAPGVRQRAKRAVFIPNELTSDPPSAWSGVLDQQPVLSHALSEVAFFHRPSRTLILTDLIENFELRRVRPFWLRLLLRIGGATDPDGKAPLDLQLTFLGRRRQLRAAVDRMVAWGPERLILAHGRWYPENATAELLRAFRWVLKAQPAPRDAARTVADA